MKTMRGKKAFSWDEGLDYEKTYKLLATELKRSRKKTTERSLVRRLYLMILLTQLRNGARVGEAIDFLVQVSEDFAREGYVRVEKRKDSRLRKMVLPKEITKADILSVKGILLEKHNRGKKQFVVQVSKW
ncbi:site-specific integrase, partial [Thermococcus prieurii]